MTIVHPGPFKFCQQRWSPFMTAIKGRPGDFHQFVYAEICHKSWCYLHILLFNVSSKDLCGLFLKRVISKGEKMRNFLHGSNFNCISREPNTRLNFLCKGQSNFMLLSFTLLQLNESVTLPK